MPNGGSDCCGTCWFNTINKGEAGYPEDSSKTIVCEIRNFVPDDPFWTYCINHPHHNSEKIKIPIGPVYVHDYATDARVEKIAASNSKEIRIELVKLLKKIKEKPDIEYPFGKSFNIEVIRHIKLIKEKNAIADLIRILSFDPLCEPNENKFQQNNIPLISITLETLAMISPKDSFEYIQPWLSIGLPVESNYEQDNDIYAPLRYHAVRAIKYIEVGDIKSELIKATNDPHPEIRAFAAEIIRLKNLR